MSSFEENAEKLDKIIKALCLVPDMERILRSRINRYTMSAIQKMDANLMENNSAFIKKCLGKM